MKTLPLLCVVACGSPKPGAPPPPLRPPVAAADAALVDAALPVAWTRESLPEWKLAASETHDPPEGETFVYAADADADELLVALASWDLLMVATQKRITGRVKADAPMDAYATITAQLGVPERGITVPSANPTGAALVTVRTAAAPFVDVMNLIGDVGNVNIVLPPKPFPALNISQRGASWNGLLLATLLLVEQTRTISGNTHYIHEIDVKLPPLGKHPNVVVDLDARSATLGQAVAALASVTKLDVGACSKTPVRLKLRKVKLAEAIRALEYASGEKLTKGGACPTRPLEEMTSRPVASATSGTKRAFIYDQGGLYVGTAAPPAEADKPASTNDWKRTAALVSGKRTPATAVVETATGWRRVTGGDTFGEAPYVARTEVHDDGVVVFSNTNAIIQTVKLAPPTTN